MGIAIAYRLCLHDNACMVDWERLVADALPEGWVSSWATSRIVVLGNEELGWVTVTLRGRCFRLGLKDYGPHECRYIYAGKGWRQALLEDAVQFLSERGKSLAYRAEPWKIDIRRRGDSNGVQVQNSKGRRARPEGGSGESSGRGRG